MGSGTTMWKNGLLCSRIVGTENGNAHLYYLEGKGKVAD